MKEMCKESDTLASASKDLRHILVAEDQSGVASLIKRIVSAGFGAEVHIAENGDAALAMMQEQHYDVLLADMMMPGVHGLDLIRQARAARQETAIVVMTGYPREFPYVDVLEAGASDFIHKPFPAPELEAKLRRILNEQTLALERAVAETKYRSLFELSSEGMVMLRHPSLRILEANSAFLEMCGQGLDELEGKPFAALLEGDSQMRFEHMVPVCLNTGKGVIADIYIHNIADDARLVDMNITFVEAGGENFVFLGCRDVTEKRQVEERLAQVAQIDELTGLFNRRSFQNRVAAATAHCRAKKSSCALILIDLDNFKACNDTFGHQVGDGLLRQVGDAIRAGIRHTSRDTGYRCGGDEFAMILQDIPAQKAVDVARRVQSIFREKETRGTTMSIGVSECKTDTAEELIRRADKALYRAKGMGKDTVEVG